MKNRANAALSAGIIVCLLFTGIKGFAQVNASFTSSTPTGCAPLVVQFTSTSPTTPSSYFWDFGNGLTSTLPKPGAIYNNAGNYNVTLIVKDASGNADTVTKTNYVTVYAKPVVDFDVTPQAGCSPLPVNFTDKSVPSSGTVATWAWDFGDGQTSDVQNPAHTYTTIDTFSVNLTVTNSFGCSNFFQKAAIVKVNGVGNVDFDYTYNNACSPPTKVTFNNTTTTNTPVTYQWFFGDGGASSQQNPVYTYTANGKYNVQLIATTDQGCTDTVTKSISVGTISPNFTLPAGGCSNRKIVFLDSSSPSPVSLKWYFGDGATASGTVVIHTYASPGQYDVKLVANFGACTDSITKPFIISAKPTPSFTSTGNRASCSLPTTINFQNTSSNTTSVQWWFGDNTRSSLPSVSHLYNKEGFYDVTLIVFNSSGCSDTLLSPQYVKAGPPKIDSLVGGPFTDCVNTPIAFSAAITSAEAVTQYDWDFGDGGTSTSATPSHSYASPGSYSVSLRITTSSGCTDFVKYIGIVRIGNKPTANFSATPTNACASTPIVFKDKSAGNITGWKWDFGDGSVIDETQNPSHLYKKTGTFSVTLTAISNGCTSAATITDYVNINPPVANFGFGYKCGNRLVRNFTDSSIGAQTWAWDFGDGQTDQTPNPSHTYSAGGTYNVKLTVTNGACSSTYRDSLVIAENNTSFTTTPALPATFCKYDSLKFNAVYDTGFIQSFYWNYGDGINSGFNAKYSTITYQYTRSGSFNPALIVKDILGCFDTIRKAASIITVYGPHAGYANIGGTCIKNNIVFHDLSTTDAAPHKINRWIWDFGDGTVQQLTDTPANHTYSAPGIYPVKLTVYDTYGCYDTLLKYRGDTITQPIAAFAAVDSIRCSISAVNFVDSSKGLGLLYTWDFGDNTTSTTPTPQHLYNKTGIYTVSLKLKDQFGCEDSIKKVNFIKISNPKASFNIADTVHYCPPWNIQPISTSANYKFLTWQFGDGNSSNLDRPQHTYITADTFRLLLIAQGYGSCFDTARKTLLLKGPSGTFTYPVSAFCAPGTVSFSANGNNVAAYQWALGDGQIQGTTTPTYNYEYKTPGVFLPQLTMIDSTGTCQVHLQNTGDSIRVADVKANFGALTGPGCDSALVSFTDSSLVFFDNLQSASWNFGDGSTAGTGGNISHYYYSDGNKQVSLTLTTALGCTNTFTRTVNVTVHPSPVVIATIPPSVCVNTTANFTASNTSVPPGGNKQWLWQFGDGATDTLLNTSHTYTAANTYPVSIMATNEFGCADTVLASITVDPLPAVYAGADSTLCLGQSATLQPAGANSYVWASSPTLSCTNCSNPIASPNVTTMYYVTGTSVAGCANTDSILVTVQQPVTVLLQPLDTLCAGKVIQLNASGADVYAWQPATGLDNPTIANPIASPAITTTYTVIGSDNNKCFADTASVQVIVSANPTVSFADSGVTIMVGDSYTFAPKTSDDVTKWLWTPIAGLSCNNCAVPVARPSITTTYTETVFNQYACSASAEFTINVLCNQQSVFIPNTFSPNGDGMNDVFYPRGASIYGIKSLRVFNRWGQIVFEKVNFKANDITSAWDGKFGGKMQPAGVYVYVTEIVCDNGSILTFKGDISLLR